MQCFPILGYCAAGDIDAFAGDDCVGIANASEIFRAARHPRSFVSLEGADHLLTEKNQAARAARIISAWADPYL